AGYRHRPDRACAQSCRRRPQRCLEYAIGSGAVNSPRLNHGDGAPVLEIEGLDIRLPPGADRRLAVEGASLSLRAGETLCVVGESGSGKSTIADAVMGLLPRPQVEPVAGSIRFLGQDLLRLGEPEM